MIASASDMSLLSTLGELGAFRPPKYAFNDIKLKSALGNKQHFLIAQHKTVLDDRICMRAKVGADGHREWMNELQVYLLPNFYHKNILTHLGSERYFSRNGKYSLELSSFLSDGNLEDDCTWPGPIRLEYWLINPYYDCITLREYLQHYTLTWTQMIRIARGILKGIYYLHENTEFQDFNRKRAVDGFIESTNGAIKRISFVNKNEALHLTPVFNLTIVHRNLTSMNIILRGDMTPCIWDFSQSHIFYPFQPVNMPQFISDKCRIKNLSSPYSPPEILLGASDYTLLAMKSIDMYACGILLWELMSRTVLPKLRDATPDEDNLRSNPGRYREPYEEEFGEHASPLLLHHAVYEQRARPTIKHFWVIGKKTYRIVETMIDLWDEHYEARLQAMTVINRLNKLTLADSDKRQRHSCKESREPKVPPVWPPKRRFLDQEPYEPMLKSSPTIKYNGVDKDKKDLGSKKMPFVFTKEPEKYKMKLCSTESLKVGAAPGIVRALLNSHAISRLKQRSSEAKQSLVNKLKGSKLTQIGAGESIELKQTGALAEVQVLRPTEGSGATPATVGGRKSTELATAYEPVASTSGLGKETKPLMSGNVSRKGPRESITDSDDT